MSQRYSRHWYEGVERTALQNRIMFNKNKKKEKTYKQKIKEMEQRILDMDLL